MYNITKIKLSVFVWNFNRKVLFEVIFQKLHIIVKYVQMESIFLIACPTVLDLEFIISIYLGI